MATESIKAKDLRIPFSQAGGIVLLIIQFCPKNDITSNFQCCLLLLFLLLFLLLPFSSFYSFFSSSSFYSSPSPPPLLHPFKFGIHVFMTCPFCSVQTLILHFLHPCFSSPIRHPFHLGLPFVLPPPGLLSNNSFVALSPPLLTALKSTNFNYGTVSGDLNLL